MSGAFFSTDKSAALGCSPCEPDEMMNLSTVWVVLLLKDVQHCVKELQSFSRISNVWFSSCDWSTPCLQARIHKRRTSPGNPPILKRFWSGSPNHPRITLTQWNCLRKYHPHLASQPHQFTYGSTFSCMWVFHVNPSVTSMCNMSYVAGLVGTHRESLTVSGRHKRCAISPPPWLTPKPAT